MPIPMARATVAQRTQLALETTYGVQPTPATKWKRLPTLAFKPRPNAEAVAYREQGRKFASTVVPNREWSSGTFEGAATYSELPFIFASLFGATAPSGPLDSSAYTWTMAPSNDNPDAPATYQMQHGDTGNQGIQVGGLAVTDATLDISRTEVKLSGSYLALPWLSGNPLAVTSGGSGATATAIITGDAVSGFGSIVGGSGYSTPPQVLLTGGGGSGATAKATVTAGAVTGITLINGGSGYTGPPTVTLVSGAVVNVENVPITPGSVTVYMDPTFGAIGSTKLARFISAQVQMTGRWGPDWVVDASQPAYPDLVELVPASSVTLKMQADSQGMSLFSKYRKGSLAYLRITTGSNGPAFSAASHYKMELDLPFQVDDLQELSDEGGVYAIAFRLAPIADDTAGFPMQMTVVSQQVEI
jgi:hypothetical protein